MMYICITKTILLPPAMILKSEQIDRQVILCHNIRWLYRLSQNAMYM